MKKILRVLSVLLSVLTVSACAFTGCVPPGTEGGGTGDGEGGGTGGGSTNKTVMRVWNYDGGVGHAWLDAAIQRFEEANKDRVIGDKVGVDIIAKNDKDTSQLGTMSTSGYAIYFTQGIRFNDYQSKVGQLLQIDDVVTTQIAGEAEGSTIESKLSQNTASSLKAYDGHYYVVPHYQSFDGVVYNKTLFEEKGLYFAESSENYQSTDVNAKSYGFVKFDNKDDKTIRTVGPDGIRGNDDDGLPSSVEEFERLLNYMLDSDVIPFIWMDGANKSYQLKFTNAVWANLEGYDGMMANFTFRGKSRIITGWNGNEPIVEEKEINDNNAWEIHQQESKYYALKLSETVFVEKGSGDNKICYYHEYAGEGANKTNTYIQETFLKSYNDTQPVAMMLEGSYWENELRSVGNYPATASNLEIRMMPLPVQAKGSVTEGNGKAPVYLDSLASYAFINGNVRTKHGEKIEELAKEFLKFLYTDVSLAEFTEKSSVVKDVNYDISPAQYNSLSSFGKTVWDAKKDGKIVVPISSHAKYYKNSSQFTLFSDIMFWKVKVGGFEHQYPYTGLTEGVSAKDYFDAMKKDITWWNGLK